MNQTQKAAYEPHSERRLWTTLRKLRMNMNHTQKPPMNHTQKATYEPHSENRQWTTLRKPPTNHTQNAAYEDVFSKQILAVFCGD
jgi:hypothetical protein